MDDYEKLRRILHKNITGAPKSEDFQEIMQLLFTPEEVKVALNMTFGLKRIDKLAELSGFSVEKASELCESMADKGIIYAREKDGKMMYALLSTIPGIFEFPLMAGGGTPLLDRLGKLWVKYHMEKLTMEFGSSPTPLVRVIPIERTIDSRNEVLPYEVLSRMMDKNENFALANCACRVAAGEDACDRPKDVCLIFDWAADFLIVRKLAKKITRQVAEEVLRRAEEAGLVHTTNNCQDRLNLVCNCCPCCCTVLTGLTKLNTPHPFAMGRWFAAIDGDLCSGCGLCLEERCPVNAIDLDGDKAVADPDRCIGCGLCASVCPEDAISMDPRKDPVAPPSTIKELGVQVLMEKGRLEEFKELNRS